MEIVSIQQNILYVEKHECRICYEDDIDVNLISPCLCSGTQKYVHMECLNRWRRENINNERFTQCELCSEDFIIRSNFEPETFNYQFKSTIPLKFFFYLVTLYLVGGLINTIDSSLNYLSFDIFLVPENFKNIIKIRNEFESNYYSLTVYYCGIASLIISSIFSILHFSAILCNIKRKKIYLKHAVGRIISYLIINLNFPISYLIYFIFSDDVLFFMSLALLSFLNLYNIIDLMYYHNLIIDIMNKDVDNQIILSREFSEDLV